MRVLEYLYRQLTDKRIDCEKCGTKIGYMTRNGHARWLCSECGEGRISPVGWIAD